MQDEAKQALIFYGLDRLKEMTRGDMALLAGKVPSLAPPPDVAWATSYEAILAGGQQREPEDVLTCIFALVEPRGDPSAPAHFYSAQSLALDKDILFPQPKEKATPAGPTLWKEFVNEFSQLPHLPQPDLETFYHLYHKYAWAVPCSYGEPGVSLFEQWKAVAALVFATGQDWRNGPAANFALIGGDIPGIQDFVYTITSKGAAKGLRGRSFFLQLLGDAVVRRLLADLGLCSCNVIYNAGGNFLLLGPEEGKAAAAVDRVRRQVNARLVEAIQGDTALVLESMPVSANDLFTPGQFKKKRDKFARQVAQAKAHPLRELAVGKNGWETLFKPKGKGSRLSCAVCRIEVDEHNSKPLERTGEVLEGAESPRICYLCDSFRELAENIRYEDLWMVVRDAPGMLDIPVRPKDGWANLLARMTGFHYQFTNEQPTGEGDVLALNRLDFLQTGAHGFRLLANVTPTVTDADIAYLQAEGLKPEELPEPGDIRSFTLLAHAAATAGAIERVGVLRMDADGLGVVFSEGMPDLTMPRLSALSGAMDLFFSGYLNVLVRNQSEKDLYIIYAGGDDLFIVGAWHHLPDLAATIRNDFKEFTGNHPALSLSGGITLEDRKFPLYRAAERAGEAEGLAKGYTRPDSRRKDALCFLGTVVGWEDWALVRQQKEEILWLIGEDKENKAKKEDERAKRLPRALLQVMQNIHQLYASGLQAVRRRVRRENRQRPADKKLPLPNPRLFFGRWAWMHVYSLTRLARQHEKRVPEAPARIKELQNKIMQPATVRYSGLLARWAEYLTRKEEW